jgi:FkbM family methyltransferase
MRFMQDYLRPGDRFIDVGANVGLYSLLARSVVGPTGRVDAFEPGTAVLPRLEESLRLNQLENVVVHRVGLGEAAGQVVFDSTGDDCTAHVAPGAIPGVHDSPNACQHDASQHDAIQIVRLDEYLPDVSYAMAKFDIEGYEPFAIRGASRFLDRGNPPVMLIEMAGYTKRHGITTPQFITILDELGYSVCVYRPQDRRLEKTSEPWTIPADNVLAVHKGREQEVVERISNSTK